MTQFIQQLMIALFVVIINASSVAQAAYNLTQEVNIKNFGEPNLTRLIKKMANVKAKVAPPDSVLRILQLGDSHTAADIFTGQLRSRLQERFGRAGIGWISPVNVYGQRNNMVYYTNTDWQLSSSRSTPALDYPMGGFIATPKIANAQLIVNYNVTEPASLWNVTFLVKQLKKGRPLKVVDGMNFEIVLDTKNNGNWQYITTHVMFPFSIIAETADSAQLGGIWLERNGEPGVTVSPVALNGAKQSIWQQWRQGWVNDLKASKSDLVIIAYGTNEALETPFNFARYKQQLITGIEQIRKKMPYTAILIVSPPDSMLKNKLKSGNSCRMMQLPELTQVKEVLQEVAKQQHTLYWDWQAVMGGDCAMRRWVDGGLATKDYIHLTVAGYQQSADSFYNALMRLLKVRT